MAYCSWRSAESLGPTQASVDQAAGHPARKPIVHPEDGHHIVSLRFSVHSPRGPHSLSLQSISLIRYTKNPPDPPPTHPRVCTSVQSPNQALTNNQRDKGNKVLLQLLVATILEANGGRKQT